MSLTEFSSPFGAITLNRYPEPAGRGQQQSLRAWDAADEYLLQELQQRQSTGQISATPKVLILNDSFGALSIALHAYQPSLGSDSFLAHEGCRRNLQSNNLSIDSVIYLDSFQMPDVAPDVVLIKVPKTLALLEDQLYRLRSVIGDSAQIIAASMAKHIHTNTLTLFEKIIGTTTTSLAKKKARLIFAEPQSVNWLGESPYPSEYTLENTDYQISNHANVFSRASLDIGTRLFLKHLPSGFSGKDIIDLGCGNGLLGVMAAAKNPSARIRFFDESYMALASAKQNFEQNIEQGNYSEATASYCADNCLEQVESNSADLVLINPPFHQGNVVGDFIAWQMLKDAKRVLRTGGEIWLVGNRHLAYHLKLERLFGGSNTIASDAKFVILKATV